MSIRTISHETSTAVRAKYSGHTRQLICKGPILFDLSSFLLRRPSTIESLYIEGDGCVLIERAGKSFVVEE